MSDPQQKAAPKKRPRWERAFLAALRDTGNVRASCEAAQVDSAVVYRFRQDDADFAAAWATALDEAADLLELEARRRAYEGVRRLRFDRGRPIMVPLLDAEGQPVLDSTGNVQMVPYVEHEYSDTLLIFLLKGARPEKFRERTQVTNITVTAEQLAAMSEDELDDLERKLTRPGADRA